jgi:hypothetical protein
MSERLQMPDKKKGAPLAARLVCRSYEMIFLKQLVKYKSRWWSLMVHPPHPEEGASTWCFGILKYCVGARLEGWGGSWFETPRTRLHNLDRPRATAPHHEAGEIACASN